jgi:hypothetical protein
VVSTVRRTFTPEVPSRGPAAIYYCRPKSRERRPRDESTMPLALLHGSGWDDLLVMGGAVLLAFVIVKLTTRGGGDEPVDPSSPEE